MKILSIQKQTKEYLVKLLTVIVVLSLTIFAQKADGQISYKVSAGSEIKVLGTSTMHDWSMLSNTFTCDGNFAIKSGQLQDINSLNFNFPVKSLKSKESQMESRAYKALNAEQYHTIAFKLTAATVLPQQKIVRATGNLTISGVTREIVIQTSYTINTDESITFKGTKPVKMSDFKLKPVSMMMGTIKTGDEVTIDILLKLKKQPSTI